MCPEKEKKLIQQLHFPGEKQSRETGNLLRSLASAGLNWPHACCMAEDQMLNGLSSWVAAWGLVWDWASLLESSATSVENVLSHKETENRWEDVWGRASLGL